MLWGGVSEPYTEHFKAGKRKLNKEQSSSEQEALSKATSQTPALRTVPFTCDTVLLPAN